MGNNYNQKLLYEVEVKVLSYLKQIVDLKQSNSDLSLEKNDMEKNFMLDLISILDAFDIKFDVYKEKQNDGQLTEEGIKIIESFRSIQRKVLRILEHYNIEEIKFIEGKVKPELCNIIDTKPDAEKANETILETLKKGYKINDKIIRKAEVITVKN